MTVHYDRLKRKRGKLRLDTFWINFSKKKKKKKKKTRLQRLTYSYWSFIICYISSQA